MPGLGRVPILALTANVMRGDKEKTLEAGCDGYIQKPLDIDQLTREIEKFLKRRANV
jgi:two-component system cell cycle response regulator DivK